VTIETETGVAMSQETRTTFEILEPLDGVSLAATLILALSDSLQFSDIPIINVCCFKPCVSW
jgi:hypothetical protein